MSAISGQRTTPKFDDYAVGAWSAGFAYPTILLFAERHYFWGSAIVIVTVASMFIPWLERYFFRSAFYNISVVACLSLIAATYLIFNNEHRSFWSSFNLYNLVPVDLVAAFFGLSIIGLVSHSYAAATSSATDNV